MEMMLMIASIGWLIAGANLLLTYNKQAAQ